MTQDTRTLDLIPYLESGNIRNFQAGTCLVQWTPTAQPFQWQEFPPTELGTAAEKWRDAWGLLSQNYFSHWDRLDILNLHS